MQHHQVSSYGAGHLPQQPPNTGAGPSGAKKQRKSRAKAALQSMTPGLIFQSSDHEAPSPADLMAFVMHFFFSTRVHVVCDKVNSGFQDFVKPTGDKASARSLLIVQLFVSVLFTLYLGQYVSTTTTAVATATNAATSLLSGNYFAVFKTIQLAIKSKKKFNWLLKKAMQMK